MTVMWFPVVESLVLFKLTIVLTTVINAPMKT